MTDDSGRSERGIGGVVSVSTTIREGQQPTVVEQPTKSDSEGMAAGVHAFKEGIGSTVVRHESMPEVKKGLLEWAKELVANISEGKK